MCVTGAYYLLWHRVYCLTVDGRSRRQSAPHADRVRFSTASHDSTGSSDSATLVLPDSSASPRSVWHSSANIIGNVMPGYTACI